ncbi:MAG: hypothetical protein IAG13_36495, partial [Deltaproteobacteria bacterium]|nr:hypothetical protein [Nannocystaceae bacterium]
VRHWAGPADASSPVVVLELSSLGDVTMVDGRIEQPQSSRAFDEPPAHRRWGPVVLPSALLLARHQPVLPPEDQAGADSPHGESDGVDDLRRGRGCEEDVLQPEADGRDQDGEPGPTAGTHPAVLSRFIRRSPPVRGG